VIHFAVELSDGESGQNFRSDVREILKSDDTTKKRKTEGE